MLEKAKQRMQQTLGISNEDFNKHVSFPHNRKIVERRQELEKYQIIAEVVQSKYCSAGLKPGLKFVFETIPPLLVPEETDCPICLRALGPLAYLVAGFWDRLIEGVDPNQGMWHIAECLDPGLEKGGLGHVVFKVYARKIE